MFFALFTLLAVSCAIRYQRPEIETQTLVRGGSESDTSFDVASLDWRLFYKDSLLRELIDTALANNLDLEIAYKRIEQASSYFKESKWGYVPKVGASANASYRKANIAAEESPYFSVGISASWEIDIWGKLTKAKRAKFQQLLAQQRSKDAIITRLIADVATCYFNLITLDAQKSFVNQTIENRENYLETVKVLKESAEVNEIAVLQAQSQLLSAKSYIPDIEMSIATTENRLSILLGKNPSCIKRRSVKEFTEPIISIDSIGLAANLLRNRPDIMAAEHALIGSLHSYNSAVAAMYPSLTLSGNISSDAASFDQWFKMPSSLIWGVIGGLTQPIFNGRALKTQKEVAYKEYEIKILEFKKSLLSAGMEVSNLLAEYKNNKEKSELLYRQYTVLNKAYEYSYELLVNGYASYLDVLTAQEGVFSTQMSFIGSINEMMTNAIEIYRALGGGWTAEN